MFFASPQWTTAEHNSAMLRMSQNPGEWLLAMRWRVRKSLEEFWVPRHNTNGQGGEHIHMKRYETRRIQYIPTWLLRHSQMVHKKCKIEIVICIYIYTYLQYIHYYLYQNSSFTLLIKLIRSSMSAQRLDAVSPPVSASETLVAFRLRVLASSPWRAKANCFTTPLTSTNHMRDDERQESAQKVSCDSCDRP